MHTSCGLAHVTVVREGTDVVWRGLQGEVAELGRVDHQYRHQGLAVRLQHLLDDSAAALVHGLVREHDQLRSEHLQARCCLPASCALHHEALGRQRSR